MTFEKMCPESVLIRGVKSGTQTIEYECKKMVNETDSNGHYVYTGLSKQIFEAGVVKYIPNYDIDWQWSHIDGPSGYCDNAEWITFGTSSNTLYITHDIPISSADVYQTTIHFGCSEANNLSVNSEIEAAIWAPFSNDTDNPKRFSAKRFDGETITYYNEKCSRTTCGNLRELLAAPLPDSQCGGLVELQNAILTTQGIPEYSKIEWELKGNFTNDFEMDFEKEFGNKEDYMIIRFNQGTNFFAVQNWDFSTASNHFYELTSVNLPVSAPNGPQCTLQWINGSDGVEGQGKVANPLSMHKNHVNLKSGNKIYDPSYGIETTMNELNFENSNFATAGGIILAVVEKSTNASKFYYWIGTENSAGMDFIID